MSGGIFPPKQNALLEILPVKKPIIGMIHLKPLPGSPHYKGESVQEMIDFALEDARRLIEGGIDGLQIENAWDLPFPKPEDFGHETVAAMTAVGVELAKMSKVPIGVNCLANAVLPAIAIAKAIQAKWVRSNQ